MLFPLGLSLLAVVVLGVYFLYRMIQRMGVRKFYEYLHDTYGPVCGFYEGSIPAVMILDVDMLKEVMVKQFESFQDRPYFPDLLRRKAGGPRGLLSAQGQYWRSSRKTLSPTFSALKMKMMVPLVNRSCVALIQRIQDISSKDESVEVFRMYGSFTMETILSTAFGRVISFQMGEADKLTEAVAAIFAAVREGENKISLSFIHLLIDQFPILTPVLRWMLSRSKRGEMIQFIHNTAVALVKARRQEGDETTHQDLLQLMIDASGEDGKLSDEGIVAHSITFILAGYETTANALAFTSYLLALHPHVQKKLQLEIDEYFQKNGESSLYDAAQKISYLHMVIQESLRLYPPAPRVMRSCKKTCVIGGTTIPINTRIHIPIALLHTSPQFWDEPLKFDPERFSPDKMCSSLCYMPFGYGPRNCIGQRFALMEAKMALIQILRKFSFVRTTETEVPLETVLGITLSPKNGIYLKIVDKMDS